MHLRRGQDPPLGKTQSGGLEAPRQANAVQCQISKPDTNVYI